VQHFIGTYGYFAIFILMVAESACIPIPSELTMPLGGALAAGASAGVHPSLVPVIAVWRERSGGSTGTAPARS
jgi:membrane protein DedA with SNARE-associated domain